MVGVGGGPLLAKDAMSGPPVVRLGASTGSFVLVRYLEGYVAQQCAFGRGHLDFARGSA